MRLRFFRTGWMAIALLIPAAGAMAANGPAATAPDAQVMQVQFQDAHIVATPAGGSVAVSMLVVNPSKVPLELVGASTPMAGQTVLQRYVKDREGMVQITPVNSLTLAAQSETVLAPGALELQLVGLTTELQAGLEVPLTLKFAGGTQRVIRVKIEGE